MRLKGFKYLKKQRILTLTIVLTLSSTLFSTTAISLLSLYRGWTAYLGEGEDIIAIYDRKSSTPFTGLVPAYLAGTMLTKNGVLASSPEAIAPCSIKNELIFLRGIMPEDFARLNPLTIVEGNMLKRGDLYSAVLGKNSAKKLNVRPGGKILVFGTLTERYLELHAKGVYSSNSPLDDEILAPLPVGQWLRGTDYNHVTLIRLKIDRDVTSPAAIFEEIAKEASKPTQSQEEAKPPEESPITASTLRFMIEDIEVGDVQKFMKNYMDRYGMTKEALLVFSVTVFVFSSIAIAAAIKTLITQHKGEINVLRSIGASEKLLKRDIFVKLLPWSLIASSIGMALATALLTAAKECGYLQVLSHTVQLQLDPLIMAINFTLAILLVLISILKEDLE